MSHEVSLAQAMDTFLAAKSRSRSHHTGRTYGNALKAFAQILCDNDLPPAETRPNDLPEDAIAWFAEALKDLSPATERLYLTAVTGFYRFLVAEGLASPNLPRLQMLIENHARRPGVRLPQFPKSDIEKVLDHINTVVLAPVETDAERLRNLRDRALLLTLADTGLRVHEACGLYRRDIDWDEGKAIVKGKGDREAVVRFSQRAIRALRDYLSARAAIDGATGRQLAALPLFARHDKGAGQKIKPITTATGRNIVAQRVSEALGGAAAGTITPHSFRHYFVTTVLQASGNLKLAQELARHRNISVTQRYAHLSDDELDRGYWEIFETKAKD
jgi:site-specific recombinase XerD